MIPHPDPSPETAGTTATWEVESCRARKYLFMRIRGFFTEADVSSFAASVAEHLRAMRPLPLGGHVSVCDASGVMIQSQAAVAAFTAMLQNPVARSRRLVFVSDAALARIQIRRLAGRDDIGLFDTIEQAEAWVMEPDPA